MLGQKVKCIYVYALSLCSPRANFMKMVSTENCSGQRMFLLGKSRLPAECNVVCILSLVGLWQNSSGQHNLQSDDFLLNSLKKLGQDEICDSADLTYSF